MNRDEALEFLKSHSPMPDDSKLTQELIDQFDAAWRVFDGVPDPAWAEPLLLAFGRWGGRGVYQLAIRVFRGLADADLEAPLREALASPHEGVRYWACQVAAQHPAARVHDHLETNLAHGNGDVRMMAAQALAATRDPRYCAAIRRASRRAKHEDDRKMFEEIAESLDSDN